MSNKTLSIIIPTIGRCVLDKTIESVLNQSVMPYEIVIWDNSGERLAYNQSKYKDDPRLKWRMSDEKKDIITSWICAVECAAGEYVYLLGDDDLLLPGFVDKVLQKLNNGAELIHVPAQMIDPEDNIVDAEKIGFQNDCEISESEFYTHYLNEDFNIFLGSIVFSRIGYEKIGRYKNIVMYGLYMDILFNFEMIHLYGKITVLSQPVWQYRTFVSDWSGKLKSKDEIPELINQYFALLKYLKKMETAQNKIYLRKYERKNIFCTISATLYKYEKWQAWKLIFYKDFTLVERYYVLRDLFYLMRHDSH